MGLANSSNAKEDYSRAVPNSNKTETLAAIAKQETSDEQHLRLSQHDKQDPICKLWIQANAARDWEQANKRETETETEAPVLKATT